MIWWWQRDRGISLPELLAHAEPSRRGETVAVCGPLVNILERNHARRPGTSHRLYRDRTDQSWDVRMRWR